MINLIDYFYSKLRYDYKNIQDYYDALKICSPFDTIHDGFNYYFEKTK